MRPLSLRLCTLVQDVRAAIAKAPEGTLIRFVFSAEKLHERPVDSMPLRRELRVFREVMVGVREHAPQELVAFQVCEERYVFAAERVRYRAQVIDETLDVAA